MTDAAKVVQQMRQYVHAAGDCHVSRHTLTTWANTLEEDHAKTTALITAANAVLGVHDACKTIIREQFDRDHDDPIAEYESLRKALDVMEGEE
jgi:hypothetical protein